VTLRVALRRGPAAPIAIGIATSVVMLAIFGSLRSTGAFHDETAYILQSRIFASGRWTADARPLPEFFQEIHTFDSPVVAARYWPGHSLMLIPGALLGRPTLMPVVLAGIMGGLFFALARRVAGTLVAVLAWAIWISAPDNLYFGPTYFSELTTGPLLLLCWWALLEWREGRRGEWLLVIAFCLGWGTITRPLTMLAYGVPVAVVVLRDIIGRKAYRDLLAPLAVAAACLAIVPLWSSRTMGSWRTIPYTEYARLYLPVDKLGFTTDRSPPVRPMPPDLAEVSRKLALAHDAHTVSTIPQVLGQRFYDIGKGMWGWSRLVLLPFAFLSVVAWPAGATFALLSAVTQVLFYMVFGYDRGWTVYYFELLPVLAFLTAVGMAVSVRWIVRRMQSSSLPPRLVNQGLAAMAVIWGAAGFFHIVGEIGLARAKHNFLRIEQDAFAKALEPVRDPAAVVFIRYAPGHSPHLSLIDNGPDLQRVQIWKVYDRGPDNARLMQRFPDRVPYLYDEPAGAVRRLTP
jgi:hypothetical protein